MRLTNVFGCNLWGQYARILDFDTVIVDGDANCQVIPLVLAMTKCLCKQLHYVNFCNFFAKCGLTIKNIR